MRIENAFPYSGEVSVVSGELSHEKKQYTHVDCISNPHRRYHDCGLYQYPQVLHHRPPAARFHHPPRHRLTHSRRAETVRHLQVHRCTDKQHRTFRYTPGWNNEVRISTRRKDEWCSTLRISTRRTDEWYSTLGNNAIRYSPSGTPPAAAQ